MLNCKDFHWGNVWRDEHLQNVLSSTKSKVEKDYRFIALYSYLAGQSKPYEIDRFICLWTAMNAHYNYIAKCYENRISEGTKLLGKDSPLIGVLIRILNCGNRKPTRNEKDKNIRDYGAMKEYLRDLSESDLISLYNDLFEHRKDLKYVPNGKLGNHLSICVKHSKISAYAFMLLEYAYYLRCTYVHGNKTTVLFATYNDTILCALRAVNYFLTEYLKSAIPHMFEENFFTTEMYDICKNIYSNKTPKN